MYLDNYNKIINSDIPEAFFVESKDRTGWYLFDFEEQNKKTVIYWIKEIKTALPFTSMREITDFIELLEIKNRNIKIKYVENLKEL